MVLSTRNIIDWDSVLASISEIDGSRRHIDQTIDNKKTDFKTYQEIILSNQEPKNYARPAFTSMVDNFYRAGYNLNNITFENYYPSLEQYFPEVHFSVDVIRKFEKIVNVSVQESWISKVDPYWSVPFHIDEYDREVEWNSKKLVRFVVFIDEPIKNQIFVVGNHYYENIEKHTVVKWPTTKEIHALINCSGRPNFLFHFLGFEND